MKFAVYFRRFDDYIGRGQESIYTKDLNRVKIFENDQEIIEHMTQHDAISEDFKLKEFLEEFTGEYVSEEELMIRNIIE